MFDIAFIQFRQQH